jgi:hypothetical protein
MQYTIKNSPIILQNEVEKCFKRCLDTSCTYKFFIGDLIKSVCINICFITELISR